MNLGQEKFLSFILERVQEGKENNARDLLNESFAKQADGSFDVEYLSSFAPRMIGLLKADKVEEVKMIMSEFGKKQS